MSKTKRRPKSPSKPMPPKKPYALVLALLLVLAAAAPSWADEPKDSKFLRLQLGYGSTSEIPGTDGQDSKPWCLGLTWSMFLAEDFSLNLSTGVPLGDAGQDNVSEGLALHYYFSDWFIPLAVTYRGDFDSIALGSGFGWEYQTPGRAVFSVAGTGDYLTDTDIDNNWLFGIEGTVGWRLGKE